MTCPEECAFWEFPIPPEGAQEACALDYKQLGGDAQTRRPPATPKAGGSGASQTQSTQPPDEEDSDPEKTITNSEDGDDEYLPSEDDPKMNQISLLMNFCQDEWGPWCLRPGPIHKGV